MHDDTLDTAIIQAIAAWNADAPGDELTTHELHQQLVRALELDFEHLGRRLDSLARRRLVVWGHGAWALKPRRPRRGGEAMIPTPDRAQRAIIDRDREEAR
jgi:hypothetical protein